MSGRAKKFSEAQSRPPRAWLRFPQSSGSDASGVPRANAARSSCGGRGRGGWSDGGARGEVWGPQGGLGAAP
jgi:hypothetical protein